MFTYKPRHRATFYPRKVELSFRTRAIMTSLGVVTVAGAAFLLTQVEEAPVSKRRRVMLVPVSVEDVVGDSFVESFASKVLPATDPRAQLVLRVAKPVVAAADRLAGVSKSRAWRVGVVEQPVINAFCAPGRVIIVNTGLLDRLDAMVKGELTDDVIDKAKEVLRQLGSTKASKEDLLAAVLAHECGHGLARHSAEQVAWWPFFAFVSLLNDASPSIARMVTLGVQLPLSRMMEREADALGLAIMAEACIDPNAMVELHTRMTVLSKAGGYAEWLSTHPAPINRVTTCTRLAAEANGAMEGRCSGPQSYSEPAPEGASWAALIEREAKERE